jgi:hypothetical protein
MKVRATSYSSDPNRWPEQKVLWKRRWVSHDVRRRLRRPLEQEKRAEQNEPPRKFYGKRQVRKPPPCVQVDSVNRARNIGLRVRQRVLVQLDFRIAVRTTVVHFLRYRCVVFLGLLDNNALLDKGHTLWTKNVSRPSQGSKNVVTVNQQ